MRRCDTHQLINALIRRRHNDALRIRRLKSRLNDIVTVPTSSIDLSNKIMKSLQKLSKNSYDKEYLKELSNRLREGVLGRNEGNITSAIQGMHLMNNAMESDVTKRIVRRNLINTLSKRLTQKPDIFSSNRLTV